MTVRLFLLVLFCCCGPGLNAWQNSAPFHAVTPYFSWTYPGNTFGYGVSISVFGRSGTRQSRKIRFTDGGSIWDTKARPGYSARVFCGVVDPGLRGRFQGLEMGTWFTPFWLKEYDPDNKNEKVMKFYERVFFSAAYVAPLTDVPPYAKLGAGISHSPFKFRPLHRCSFRLFYNYALGWKGLPASIAPHSAGIEIGFRAFGWRKKK